MPQRTVCFWAKSKLNISHMVHLQHFESLHYIWLLRPNTWLDSSSSSPSLFWPLSLPWASSLFFDMYSVICLNPYVNWENGVVFAIWSGAGHNFSRKSTIKQLISSWFIKRKNRTRKIMIHQSNFILIKMKNGTTKRVGSKSYFIYIEFFYLLNLFYQPLQWFWFFRRINSMRLRSLILFKSQIRELVHRSTLFETHVSVVPA